jgi:tetratricopeptide (TPR) repeat protein
MSDARHYVGIGISNYTGGFKELPRAAEDATSLGDYLRTHRGFVTEVLVDVVKASARPRLEPLLSRPRLPDGCAVLVLWSGHAELDAGRLHLIAHDTAKGSAVDLTPDWFADLVARTGATRFLLLLDTCFAGAGMVSAQHIAQQVANRTNGRFWFGVMAAAHSFERARDGVFVTELMRLLRDGPRTAARRRVWSVHNSGVRASDLMETLDEEWPKNGGQRPEIARLGNELLEWPGFFANPRYDEHAVANVVEHLLLASDGRAPDEEGTWFTGRTAEVDTVVGWVRAAQPGVHVVTGPAGCGKSAITGRVAALSHPQHRSRLLSLGALHHEDPGVGSVHATVYLRGLTADQASAQIDAALVASGTLAKAEAPRSRIELLGAVQTAARPIVMVLDGLDEARDQASAIATDLIQPLAGTACVLLSSRRIATVADKPELLTSLAARATIDLGEARIAESGKNDLRSYVASRLAEPYPDAEQCRRVTAAVANTSEHQHDEGSFLLARVLTSQLRREPLDLSQPKWQSRLSTSIHDALLRDIESSGDPERARDVLTALAWSYGSGFPDDLWRLVATTISRRRTYEPSDLDVVAFDLGRYIVEDGDDGRAVYRLSHQSLVEALRPKRSGYEFDQQIAEALPIAVALAGRYGELLQAGIDVRTPGYLWRHAWSHGADGGIEGIGQLRGLVPLAEPLLPDLAAALQELGNRLGEVGRHHDALPPTEEAVAIRRELAAQNPAFRADLAMALNNLGIRLHGVGRHHDALPPTEEAAAIYRQLAAQNPAFRPDLAMALNNLGRCFREVGRHHDALPPTDEAVAIRRELTAQNPAFRPDLASALNNLGISLSKVGRHHDALPPTEVAAAIYRDLAAHNHAFRPDLAIALNNLGTCFFEVGRHHDALPPTEDAVAICRELTAQNPAFRQGLASALNNLGAYLGEVGRHHDALPPTEDAVAIYRVLAAQNPAFRPDLAMALNNLGIRLSEVRRRHDALPPTEEAVSIDRELAAQNPGFRPDLALALNNLGNRLSEVGRHHDALPPTEEAVVVRRELAEQNPAFRPGLASALNNLGIRLSEVGRRHDALPPAEEAVAIYRDLAAQNPAHWPHLRRALGNLARWHKALGNAAAAKAARAELDRVGAIPIPQPLRGRGLARVVEFFRRLWRRG